MIIQIGFDQLDGEMRYSTAMTKICGSDADVTAAFGEHFNKAPADEAASTGH